MHRIDSRSCVEIQKIQNYFLWKRTRSILLGMIGIRASINYSSKTLASSGNTMDGLFKISCAPCGIKCVTSGYMISTLVFSSMQKNHYQDLPDNVKRHLGPMPEGFLSYFTRRYPRLFLHVHSVVANTGLCNEPMFRSYFEVAD